MKPICLKCGCERCECGRYRNNYVVWFRGPERFVWDWQPWSRETRWRKGYLRVRVFGIGFNFYYGQTKYYP